VRPGRLVCVLGTATEIGKTWVSAATLGILRARGVSVAARKPVQSFDPGDSTPTDADQLAAATGAAATEVCPSHRWYPLAMAPPMAAEELGRPAFTVADLTGEMAWPGGIELGLVETVGGPRSPIAADGDSLDLCAAVQPDRVVLVADAGLGTINAVQLSLGAAEVLGVPVVVVLNRYDDGDRLHAHNRRWLSSHLSCPVLADCRSLADALSG
jgi:dethiobiotin synthase